MPYVINHYDGLDAQTGLARLASRHAVATLEEARQDANEALSKTPLWDDPNNEAEGSLYREFAAQCQALPESGGTVGPLPDGTVIEVERVTPGQLRVMVDGDDSYDDWMSDDEIAEIIDAYNAWQSASNEAER